MFQKNWYVVIQKGIDYREPIYSDLATGKIRTWRTQIGALIGARRHVKEGDGTFKMRDVEVHRNIMNNVTRIDLNKLRD